MASQVSERGQITVDRSAREALGVRPGMVAYQRVVAGRLEVLFLPAPHRRSLFGVLRRPGERSTVLTSDDVEHAVVEALADAEADGPNRV